VGPIPTLAAFMNTHALHRIHRLEQLQAELRDEPDHDKALLLYMLEKSHHQLLELETEYIELTGQEVD